MGPENVGIQQIRSNLKMMGSENVGIPQIRSNLKMIIYIYGNYNNTNQV
jgi:hypothetical protein